MRPGEESRSVSDWGAVAGLVVRDPLVQRCPRAERMEMKVRTQYERPAARSPRTALSVPVAFAVAVVLLLFLFCLPGIAQAQGFTDVAGDEYFAPALESLSDQGVVQGRSDGSFGPQAAVTRSQLAALLCRTLSLPPSATIPFTDITSLHWSYGYVAALYWAGLISGDAQGRFLPDTVVSRQQAARMIVAVLARRIEEAPDSDLTLLGPSDPTGPWLAAFRDRGTVAPEHARALADVYRLNVMQGSADGWLYPTLPLNRAQMVVLIYRAFYEPLVAKTAYPVEVASEWYPKQSSGSRGMLVQILEARLTALHYPCGPEDGVYDYRTKDAVMAFEKVERLPRNGIVDQEVWQRLFSTSTPSPRLDSPGGRAEVDLKRQVLFIIQDNLVVKIIHVSTGKDGTPTGHGKVYHKDRGWIEVPVGWMYSPSYIMPHIAIHGSKSVPPYPASHGCVRTPMWVTDDLYRELPLGFSVDVYY